MKPESTNFNRLQAWESLAKDPFFGTMMKKMSESGKRWLKMFIQDNEDLTTAEFRAKVHYLDLDNIRKAPKYTLELLSAANSRAKEIK